jgi:hypothetical protein
MAFDGTAWRGLAMAIEHEARQDSSPYLMIESGTRQRRICVPNPKLRSPRQRRSTSLSESGF